MWLPEASGSEDSVEDLMFCSDAVEIRDDGNDVDSGCIPSLLDSSDQ